MKFFANFIRLEAASSILLLGATALALAWANSPFQNTYHALQQRLTHGVNDGLMTLFFLLVGAEIKREMVSGELASLKKSILPFAGALGGMLVPAAIYSLLNRGLQTSSGWGIPMATDIAFAIGVLSILGSRIPLGLKVFLMALAILDDIGAILVIGLFYSSEINIQALALAGLGVGILFMLNRYRVHNLLPFVAIGLGLWVALSKAGIHATLAGVIVAFFLPIQAYGKTNKPVLIRVIHRIHPWVTFGIVPLFAFVNAGITMAPEMPALLFSPMGLGIVLGLCIGKPLGIWVFAFIAVKLKLAELPNGVGWKYILGVGMLGGIGFTMSLFIADIGIPNSELLEGAKLAVLSASMISGFLGVSMLLFFHHTNVKSFH